MGVKLSRATEGVSYCRIMGIKIRGSANVGIKNPCCVIIVGVKI